MNPFKQFRAFRKRRAERKLFVPASERLYLGLTTESPHAHTVYVPSFDRIFLLLAAFYSNGLRGELFEFGVYRGYTAKLMADRLKSFSLGQLRLHLFDSFEGLPPSTDTDLLSYECQKGCWRAGVMKVATNLEKRLEKKLQKELGRERVAVIKGFFEKTLEHHIHTQNIKKVALIHLDCDLYSSSKYVLRTLFEYDLIQEGTILICDDWMTSFGNPFVGQRRAVSEILEEYPHWEFEPYFNYGLGSQVFIVHNLTPANSRRLTPV